MAATLLRPGGLREFARLAAEAAAVGVFASFVLFVAALMISSARAAPPEIPHGGALLFATARRACRRRWFSPTCTSRSPASSAVRASRSAS